MTVTQNNPCPDPVDVCIEPTDPPQDTGDDSGVVEDVSGVIGDAVGAVADTATSTATGVVDDVVDTFAGGAIEILNRAAGEMAGGAFGDLASHALTAGEPELLIVAGIAAPAHFLAAAIAFAGIATTLLFIMLRPRRQLGERLYWMTASTAKYMLITSFGVVIGLAAVEISQELTRGAIASTLPEGGINTDGVNIYTGALAAVIVPIVGVAFEFQAFFLAVLLAFWPLAAAVSITRMFRHALPIFTALIAANAIWPPLAALAVGKAFAALPDVGTATWWTVAAVCVAPIANAIALMARSTT